MNNNAFLLKKNKNESNKENKVNEEEDSIQEMNMVLDINNEEKAENFLDHVVYGMKIKGNV